MTRCRIVQALGVPISALACNVGAGSIGGFGDGGSGSSTTGNGVTTNATSTDDEGTSTAATTGHASVFDVGNGDSTGELPPVDVCKVGDADDASPLDCKHSAPPDAFEPDIQWTWTGPGDELTSLVTPLVANLTDDNGDGAIDLCDVPDIVVIAFRPFDPGHIYVLDGATGALHFRVDTPVSPLVNPALGDIDGDGLVEIVAARGDVAYGSVLIAAFEHDGTPKWETSAKIEHGEGGAISLADLDNDGDVEVLAGSMIFDHHGATVASLGEPVVEQIFGSFPADLDGDGDLEVLVGAEAYHHDGEVYYEHPEEFVDRVLAVADLDADPEPEVVVAAASGLWIYAHDGAPQLGPVALDPLGEATWYSPATVHDFDGDGDADVALATYELFHVLDGEADSIWTTPVVDQSGMAASTAFDFDGDAIAEAMYADERDLHVFGPSGADLLTVPRSSRTLIEYPVVADVDNDGSAEIVVVSGERWDGPPTAPTVQVIRDVEDRWVQARRIWNQHAYHVTNVREDGTIPRHQQPSWSGLNTFRTNSQIENGGICTPPAG